MHIVKTVRVTSVIPLIVATALSGCTGRPEPTTSLAPGPTLSPTAAQPATPRPATEPTSPTTSSAAGQSLAATTTTPAEAAPLGCTDLDYPALVLVPPPGGGIDPRRFILADPRGEQFCSLGAPYIPWASTDCQVVDERLMCWDETRNALQILDVRRDELAYVDPELGDEEAHPGFLVSPDGEHIVWSTTDIDAGHGDLREGASRCRLCISQADGSHLRTVVEETYENPYHLMPVTWTPDGSGIFFARVRVWVESGGAFIPSFSGRYSELFRLDLASREFQKVFPLDDATVCNRCIGDVSPHGHWLAYHREDGALVLRDLVNGEETLVADASSACYLGRARFSPTAEHLVYVELEGPCDERDTFDVARTVMVDVPFEGQSRVLAGSTEAVDWPVGWLDGQTPIFDRVYKGFDQRGRWVAGHSSASEDLLSGILVGVLRPSRTASERETPPRALTLPEFPLEVGDSWTYEIDLDYEEGGEINEYHLVQNRRVVESTIGDGFQVSKILIDNKTVLQDSDTIWYVADDRMVYSASGSRGMQRLMERLKGAGTGYHFDPAFVFPLAVGSRWGDPGAAKSGHQWEVEAQEDVDVPAGHFDECYRLTYVANTGYTRRWVCPGVGVVAWETHHNGTVIDEKAKLIDFDVHQAP